MIEYFPSHPKVREIALYQLQNREGDLGTVAKVYSSDDKIRCELLKVCNPLPAHLRLGVVDRLVRLAPEDDFSHNLLSIYDEDTDANVKTAASIGYMISVKRRGEISSSLLDKLNKGLRAVGPDLDERRQAAFSALLELDRLDIVEIFWSEDGMRDINLSRPSQTNLRLAAHLARHWNRVSKAFGESFWERVGWLPDKFLTEMAAHTTDPDLLDIIIDRPKRNAQETPTMSSLQLCAHHWRGTQHLRELCLTLVSNSEDADLGLGIVAAEILAEQFDNDTKTFDMLDSLVTQGNTSSALVVALSAGWPDSQAWKQLSERVQLLKLLLPAGFSLLAAISPPDKFVTEVGTKMAKLRDDRWGLLPSCSRAVASCFARDQQVRELAFSRLQTQPTSFEKMNFPTGNL